MEITNIKASFPHLSKSLLAYFEIPKEYLKNTYQLKNVKSNALLQN
jgi:hypothetical protein